MSELQRSRIRERLDAKALNPFEAARMAGFQRNYFHDLLIGKKQSIREKQLPAAAAVLECDPEYLVGIQDTPRKRKIDEIKIEGICEAGAWRDDSFIPPDIGPIAADPDPRLPAARQHFYLVRGDHAAGLGIIDGSLIIVGDTEAVEAQGRRIHAGDAVLVRRTNDGLFEITAREWQDTRDGVRLSAKPLRGELPALSPGPNVVVIGLILRTIRVFATQL